jgi:hypothetical protein
MREGLGEQSPATGQTPPDPAVVGRRWSVQRAGRGLGRTLVTQYRGRVTASGSKGIAARGGAPTRTTAANR